MTQKAMTYAKALFGLNISEECIEGAINEILDNKELFLALSNPSVKRKEKHAVIDAIFEPEVRNFLKVLSDHDCIEIIKEVFDAYQSLKLESRNIVKATITYVTKPEADDLEKMKKFVSDQFNKADVIFELKEDPALLGGFILSIGDMEYDRSIRGMMDRMQKTLVWR